MNKKICADYTIIKCIEGILVDTVKRHILIQCVHEQSDNTEIRFRRYTCKLTNDTIIIVQFARLAFLYIYFPMMHKSK